MIVFELSASDVQYFNFTLDDAAMRLFQHPVLGFGLNMQVLGPGLGLKGLD